MINQDILWKGIIEDLFPELMAFFYPESLDQLDLTRIESLDKELEQLFIETTDMRRYADKLIKVAKTDQTEQWMLIHVEVQGYHDTNFAERMFRYYYRIYDRYGIEIEALAIFTDSHASYHPSYYEMQAFKTVIRYDFHTYKVREQRREDLEANGNPFALPILVAWEAIYAGEMPDEDLLELKLKLFRKLLQSGCTREQISRLTSFIKYYTQFEDSEMNVKFEEAIDEIKQNPEKMGIHELILHEVKRESLKEGMEKGMEKAVRNLLIAGILTPEQIATALQVNLRLVRKIQKELASGK